MANPSIKRIFGPVALTATLTTNVGPGPGYGGGSALIYDILKHLHIVNKTGGTVTFTLYIGGTGGNVAGTEWFNAQPVTANNVYDWYGNLKLTSTDFLVGGASALTSLTITLEGESYVV